MLEHSKCGPNDRLGLPFLLLTLSNKGNFQKAELL